MIDETILSGFIDIGLLAGDDMGMAAYVPLRNRLLHYGTNCAETEQ